MTGLGRRWWIAVVVAVVVALGAGTWRLLTGDTRGAEIATVLALPVAILALGAAVVTMALGAGGAKGKMLLSAAQQLAGDVRAQESAALARLVADTGDTRPADMAFAQRQLLSWRSDGDRARGSLTQIETFYRGLRWGRMVVLGEAGAGKTVLVIQLIRDLAAVIVDNPPSPEHGGRVVVPVRLSLPAFAPAVRDDHLDGGDAGEYLAKQLDQWVAGHLVTVYGLTMKVAVALVTGGWVLPVLDGLDEMDPDDVLPRRAAALMRAVNHPTAVGMRPVVLTCRTRRYIQLSGHALIESSDGGEAGAVAGSLTVGADASGESVAMQDATVVSVEPLTALSVVNYLTYRFPDPADRLRIESRWHPIVKQLTARNGGGDPLAAALGSPLRLFLTVITYRHHSSTPNELTRLTTTAQLDEHLFARLVPAVLEQHPPVGQRYAASEVTRWLTTLARHLAWQGERAGSSSDLRLDLLWPAAGWCAPRYAATAVMTMAAGALLIFGVLARWPPDVLPVLGLGAYVVVAAWIALRPTVDLRRFDLSGLRTSAGRRRVGRLLAVGLTAGLVSGLTIASVSPVVEDVGQLIVTVKFSVLGLVGSLMVGLGSGPTTQPTAIDRPARLVQQGIVHTIVAMVAVQLTFLLADKLVGSGLSAGVGGQFVAGLGTWLAIGLASGPAIGSAAGVAVGLNSSSDTGGVPFAVVALVIGLIFAANSPWPRYMFAVMLLVWRGDLPRRPAVFIDWAYQAGLMRLSGIAVQFRHREFQDWLVTTHPA